MFFSCFAKKRAKGKRHRRGAQGERGSSAFPEQISLVTFLFGDKKVTPWLSVQIVIYETDTPFRKSEMALFSNLDTWAWEMPRAPATSIWVFPS